MRANQAWSYEEFVKQCAYHANEPIINMSGFFYGVIGAYVHSTSTGRTTQGAPSFKESFSIQGLVGCVYGVFGDKKLWTDDYLDTDLRDVWTKWPIARQSYVL